MSPPEPRVTLLTTSYLESLTLRLAVGVSQLPEAFRAKHARFFLAVQQEDGGFAGREGGSDLYYTNFALRSLALLGELHGEPADRARGFLAARLTGQASIVDFLSLIYSASLLNLSAGLDVFAAAAPDWRTAVSAALESLRRDDGGYAKGPEGTASSTYHTFLVALCRELIEAPLVEPDRMVAFILSQRRDDGGFVEIKPMKRSGTNPTAAAIGLLKIVNKLDDEVQGEVTDFLADMQTDEGGLRANTRIPIADLLSTFTGVLTLADLGAIQHDQSEIIDVRAVINYAKSLEQETGGFLGAVWDQAADVEYSFYGLATLGLLTAPVDQL